MRTCTNPAPSSGGAACAGADVDEEDCGTDPCPVDGNWSEWTSWTACSAACGPGTQQRSRTCDAPAPANGGKDCEGDAMATRECNEEPCESADLEGGLNDSNVESDICHLNYIKVAKHHAQGGTAAPEDYQGSRENCSVICSQVMNCLGYDWDEGDHPYKNFRCWLKIIEFSTIDGVDYTQKRNWTGESIHAFTIYKNFHGEGANQNEGIETREECAKKCLEKETCLAFDFDRSAKPWKNTRCWTHENELEAWTEGDHFMKKPCPMRQNIEP